jgi:hypothetical protein
VSADNNNVFSLLLRASDSKTALNFLQMPLQLQASPSPVGDDIKRMCMQLTHDEQKNFADTISKDACEGEVIAAARLGSGYFHKSSGLHDRSPRKNGQSSIFHSQSDGRLEIKQSIQKDFVAGMAFRRQFVSPASS